MTPKAQPVGVLLRTLVDGISQCGGETLDLTLPAVSQAIDRLVRSDLVARTEDSSDRRSTTRAKSVRLATRVRRTATSRRMSSGRLTSRAMRCWNGIQQISEADVDAVVSADYSN